MEQLMRDQVRAAVSVNYVFPHNYEVRVQEAQVLLHPAETLHQYPAVLEEGDRTGLYLRVTRENSPAWTGFFAQGFDSDQVARGVYSCPDADWLCAVAGGYAYLVDSVEPQHWIQVEQRPVVEVRALPELKLLLFTGFTSITALGVSQGIWTTERLSWEGISILDIRSTMLYGKGWDAISDKEVEFQVDLLTGKSRGGAGPAPTRR